jgi:hypothetical protein
MLSSINGGGLLWNEVELVGKEWDDEMKNQGRKMVVQSIL